MLWERARESEGGRAFIGLRGARGVGWVFHMKTERNLNPFGSLSQTPDRRTKMKPQRRVSGHLGPIIGTCSNRRSRKAYILLTQPRCKCVLWLRLIMKMKSTSKLNQPTWYVNVLDGPLSWYPSPPWVFRWRNCQALALTQAGGITLPTAKAASLHPA